MSLNESSSDLVIGEYVNMIESGCGKLVARACPTNTSFVREIP